MQNIYILFYYCNKIINYTTHHILDSYDLTYNFKFDISNEAEKFFQNYLENDQYISEKSVDDFRIKDFRDLYRID